MTPLQGFTPDAPTTTDGIITECSNWIPYEAGMRAAPTSAAQGASALGAATRGATTARYLDNSTRVIVGTSAALYSLAGTTFTDQSRGGGYTLGSTSRWSFATFGSAVYASSPDNVIQKSTSGAFANVTSSPQAKVIFPVLSSGGGFIFAGNTEVTTDTWKNSAVNNGDDWTVDPTGTLCNTGRLLGAEGPITAGAQIGTDLAVFYKNRSIYVGTFVGAPNVWEFREIPTVGCVGQDALVSLGSVHAFLGEDNFYMFDGNRPTPFATGQVRQWFFDNSSPDFRYATQMVFDRDASLIWIFYVAAGAIAATISKALVYHTGSRQWGKADQVIETAFIYAAPGQTWDSDSNTWDSDQTAWDQAGSGSRIVATFDTSHTMQLLNGTPMSSSFTLCDIGDDDVVSYLDTMTLRYMTRPLTASSTAYYSMATGGVPTTGATASAFDVPSATGSVFRFRQSGRWHRVQFNFTGPCKVVGYNIPAGGIVPLGDR